MPDQLVVDTSVLSLFVKRDTRATLYHTHLAGKERVISFMTLAELRRWPLERSWGAARIAQLEEYISRFTVHHTDDDLCRLWASIVATGTQTGRPISTADAWIAATAVQLGLPLVTHNRSDFTGVAGLQLISEAPV